MTLSIGDPPARLHAPTGVTALGPGPRNGIAHPGRWIGLEGERGLGRGGLERPKECPGEDLNLHALAGATTSR